MTGKPRALCAQKTAPVAYFPAHWAPNGMVLYNQKQFPAHYQQGLFIAFHGSWNRAPYAQGGYNVVYQGLSGDKASGKCEIFADGFAGADKSPGKASHRPSGLAVGPDGALYVSDDVAGRDLSYRLSRRCRCRRCTDGALSQRHRRARTDRRGHGEAPRGHASRCRLGHRWTRSASRRDARHGGIGQSRVSRQVGGATCTGCHGAMPRDRRSVLI